MAGDGAAVIMSQFRSEEMNLVQLFVQSDAAHETLHELGQIGAIQFKDVSQTLPESNRTYLDLEAHALILKLSLCWQLNKDKTAFQRIFVQDVRKCEDMLRIIRYLKGLHAKVCGCRRAADALQFCSCLKHTVEWQGPGVWELFCCHCCLCAVELFVPRRH